MKKLIVLALLVWVPAAQVQAQFLSSSFGMAPYGFGMNGGNMGGFSSLYSGMPWGAGMYGGMQGCQSMYQPQMMMQQQQPQFDRSAIRAVEMAEELKDLRADERDAKAKIVELNTKIERYEGAINDRLQGPWAEQVLAHLSGDDTCGCGGGGAMPVDPSGLPPADGPSAEPPPVLPSRSSGTVSENEPLYTPVEDPMRAPAADLPLPSSNRYDQNWSVAPSAGGGGGCSEIANSQSWRYICRNNGVSREVCSNPHYVQEGSGHGSDCAEAVGGYMAAVRARAAAQKQIEALEQNMAELKAEARHQDDGPALAGGGGGGGFGGGGGGADPSLTGFMSALAPMAGSLLMGLGSSLFGGLSHRSYGVGAPAVLPAMASAPSRLPVLPGASVGVPALPASTVGAPSMLPALAGPSMGVPARGGFGFGGFPASPAMPAGYGYPYSQNGMYGSLLGSMMSMGCGMGMGGGLGGGAFGNPYGSYMSPPFTGSIGVPSLYQPFFGR